MTRFRCEHAVDGCLDDDRWEHTPEWSYTSKLLISKHQQVQLLEAASVLVSMNQDGTPSTEVGVDMRSDLSSASPAASRSSGLRDGLSSADTTPPPQTDEEYAVKASRSRSSKRRSSNGSAYSWSYQSMAPTDGGSLDPSSFQRLRPPYTGEALPASDFYDEDEEGLAAAVGLLSCSFGTPRTGPLVAAADIPPVPPLPARYLNGDFGNVSSRNIMRTVRNDVEDSAIEDDSKGGRSDEEDDGVFGRMEA